MSLGSPSQLSERLFAKRQEPPNNNIVSPRSLKRPLPALPLGREVRTAQNRLHTPLLQLSQDNHRPVSCALKAQMQAKLLVTHWRGDIGDEPRRWITAGYIRVAG